jgi:hypothetical protein
MSAELQRIVALAIVALAALGLLLRWVLRRKPPGCAGACSCPSRKIPR